MKKGGFAFPRQSEMDPPGLRVKIPTVWAVWLVDTRCLFVSTRSNFHAKSSHELQLHGSRVATFANASKSNRPSDPCCGETMKIISVQTRTKRPTQSSIRKQYEYRTVQLQVENVFKLEIPWSREPSIFLKLLVGQFLERLGH